MLAAAELRADGLDAAVRSLTAASGRQGTAQLGGNGGECLRRHAQRWRRRDEFEDAGEDEDSAHKRKYIEGANRAGVGDET